MPGIRLKFNTVLFDLDGTLIDSSEGIEYALRQAVREVAPDFESKLTHLKDFIGAPLADVLRKALAGADTALLNSIERHFRPIYNGTGWKLSKPYTGVPATLATLNRLGVTCCIVTNKPNIPTRNIIMRLDLISHFRDMVSPDSAIPAFASKIDVTRHTLHKHAFDPDKTLFVGDAEEDAQAASICHIAFAAVAYGYGDVHIQEKFRKDYVVSRFSDIIDIVKPER